MIPSIQESLDEQIEHWWRNKNELISDIFLRTSTHGHTSVGHPAKSYINQIRAETGFHLEDLSRAMADRNE